MKNDSKPGKLSRLATPIESAIFLVASASLFAFLARYVWIADLLCQFRVQYMLIMSPAIVAYVVAKRPKKSAFLLVCLIANSWVLVPHVLSGKRTNQAADEIKRIIVFNVLSSNKRYEELGAYVKKNNPDIFIALETNQSWIDNMQPLFVKGLPHYRAVPREDNFGIAIFSRIPFEKISIERYGPDQLPSINVVLSIGEKKLNLIATHPLPPVRPRYAASRNEQLNQVASELSSSAFRMMAGDFNLTPWSPHFSDILKKGGFATSANGIRPTWYVFPTWLGGLQLDHVLVSPDIWITDFRVGPNLGSDHRPIIVDFALSK